MRKDTGQNVKGNSTGLNKLFGRLAAEKKRSTVALCLVGLMVFMWVRMFANKTPAGAQAALMNQGAAGSQSDTELKISFIDLPKVQGRNDRLTRDFFVVNEGSLSGTKAEFVLEDNSEEAARRVAEKLKLEAIIVGTSPQAFINDKFLSVGDILSISDGANVYECEVIEIEEGKAVVRCGETEITLKLMDM